MIQQSDQYTIGEQYDQEFPWQRVIRHRDALLWQIFDPRGVEMWLPRDLKLTVCSICQRFCTTSVPLFYREIVRYYQSGGHLPEKAARKVDGRPKCRECLDYQGPKVARGTA